MCEIILSHFSFHLPPNPSLSFIVDFFFFWWERGRIISQFMSSFLSYLFWFLVPLRHSLCWWLWLLFCHVQLLTVHFTWTVGRVGSCLIEPLCWLPQHHFLLVIFYVSVISFFQFLTDLSQSWVLEFFLFFSFNLYFLYWGIIHVINLKNTFFYYFF